MIRDTRAALAASDSPNDPGGLVPWRHILRTVARLGGTAGAVALSVSRLDAGRWRIRFPPSAVGQRRECYLSPEDGSLVIVTAGPSQVDIRLDGSLTEESVRNLGDCLVAALDDDAASIRVWLGRSDAVSLEACCLFESFGRTLGRKESRCRLEIHGEGRAGAALSRAFRRGCARSGVDGGAS